MNSAGVRKVKPSSHDCFESHECKPDYIAQELKGKLRNLKFRLLDCQNQNQMLRKELLLAKKVVTTEISPVTKEDFKELLNQFKFRGRREQIMVLREKLSELQNRIKELEDANADKSSAVPTQGDNTTSKADKRDHKMFQNKQMIDRELQYLLENSCQLKRKVELWKKRNSELSKEIELLRLELDRLLEKSQEDRTVHESYRLIDKELRARQTDKMDLRKKLDMQRTRNEQLAEELGGIKEDHSLILSKINDDKVLIDALNNQQGYLLDLLERQKMISETDNRKFQDDLREIQAKHATNSHILDHLTDIVEEKSQKCLQLQKSIKEVVDESDVSTITSITTVSELTQTSDQSESQQSSAPPSEPPPPGDEEAPSEIDIEMEKLTEECEQYKDVLPSMDEEIEQLTNTMSINSEKMNEWRTQLFQTRSLLAQKNAEIRDLEDTYKKLQKATSTSKKEAPSPPQGAHFVEEMLKTNDVLNEEYQFLLSMWKLLISNKENSLEVLTTTIEGRKQLLIDEIADIISELDMPDIEEPLSSDEEEAAQISKMGEE